MPSGLVMNPKSGKFTNKLENVSFWFLYIKIDGKTSATLRNIFEELSFNCNDYNFISEEETEFCGLVVRIAV